ncbi:heme-binding protein [Thiohalocapsa marina]|uniref:Heme-binding protein n=1 Tax=Thiohalocapsa marina TaxID=424902 RepID=A0A5M8FMP7_9GAMM|nr:heme-binding protein [Thiohalocapsa marina]KAA6184966.1 heme-binding protein [Thiohalocapsa marina]
MSKKYLLSVCCAAAIAGGAASSPALAEEPMMVSVKRLSLETAQRIAQATVDACREKGIQIGVTVVDRDGVVQAQLRDTIAAPITVPISYKKAYTAVNFNADTSALEPRANTAVGRQDFLVMSAGGVTVQVGGSLVGGVGVSGAPAGETDEECARAGVEAVQDDLEMAM